MPKISVIIPIYNVAPYIPQCLNSIQKQTLRDIEIFLINDGSTDDGIRICEKYAQKDERIKIIHKKNEGLSAARNDGIAASTSPFILFVDADDWVEPEFCEVPYRIAIENKADLVFFGYNVMDGEGSIKQMKINMKAGLLSERQAFWFNIHYTPAVWLGLYRRELFDEVQYPVGKIYEEVGTTHRLMF